MSALNHFMAIRTENPGATQHRIYYRQKARPTVHLIQSGGHFGSREAVKELYTQIIPDFLAQAGISDVNVQGYRLAVEVPQNGDLMSLHLLAGTEEQKVVSQSPQDWLTPSQLMDPNKPAKFFDDLSAAARTGLATMPLGTSGVPLYYSGGDRKAFAIMDADPKTETHFLVLASDKLVNMSDPEFTVDHFVRLFEVVYGVCGDLGITGQPIRIAINTGSYFQVVPRVHMHVLSAANGLPSMFPADYGFATAKDGTIEQVDLSADGHFRGYVFDLLRQRKEYGGFTDQHRLIRRGIDLFLMQTLRSISPKAGLF